MNFVKLTDIDENLLVSFLGRTRFGRFLSNKSLPISKSIEFELQKIKTYASLNYMYVAIDNNILVGVIGFRLSLWDTEIFNKRYAKIDYLLTDENEHISAGLLLIFDEWAKQMKVDVAVSRLEAKFSKPIISVQKAGFSFYEAVDVCTLNLPNSALETRKSSDFQPDRKDNENLKVFAMENTYQKSHFFLDDKFGFENSKNLYYKWMESSLLSDDNIIVTKDESGIVGSFIYKVHDLTKTFGFKFCEWKWGAIKKDNRGYGQGKKLFETTIKSIDNDVSYIDSFFAYQNVASHNLHDILGFKHLYNTYTFHKWF